VIKELKKQLREKEDALIAQRYVMPQVANHQKT
jgi:hypothetical protein